jgi:predicted transcriptional regulator
MIENVKISFKQDGLKKFFKSWEIECLRYLLKNHKASSRQIHNYVIEYEDISRASVIVFMNKMVEWGLVTLTTGTGKGGYRNYYQILPTYIHEVDIYNWVITEIERNIS